MTVPANQYTGGTNQLFQRFPEWQDEIARRKRSVAVADPALTEQRLRLLGDYCGSTRGLADYLRRSLNLDPDVPIVAPPLTTTSAAQMTASPASLEWERSVYKGLSHVTQRQAQIPVVWYLWHIAWLEERRFTDPPRRLFNANRADTSRAAHELSAQELNDLDADIRNLLRRLGGFPRGRGTRPAQDAPIPRAWWRRKLAITASDASTNTNRPLAVDECHQALLAGDWGRFTDRAPSSYAVVLNPRALAAICRIRCDSPSVKLLDAVTAVAQRCEYQHPQYMDFERLSALP